MSGGIETVSATSVLTKTIVFITEKLKQMKDSESVKDEFVSNWAEAVELRNATIMIRVKMGKSPSNLKEWRIICQMERLASGPGCDESSTCAKPVSLAIKIAVDGDFDRNRTTNVPEKAKFEEIKQDAFFRSSNDLHREMLVTMKLDPKRIPSKLRITATVSLDPTATESSAKEVQDVQLLVGNSIFEVNQASLCRQSEVFSAMLSHPMKEFQTKQIKIEDFDEVTVKAMVNFVHTAKLTTEEATADVIAIADKYDIQSLVLACEVRLIESLSTSNAMDLLLNAERLQRSNLRKHSLEFVQTHLAVIKEQTGFEPIFMENPALMYEVFVSHKTQNS